MGHNCSHHPKLCLRAKKKKRKEDSRRKRGGRLSEDISKRGENAPREKMMKYSKAEQREREKIAQTEPF